MMTSTSENSPSLPGAQVLAPQTPVRPASVHSDFDEPLDKPREPPWWGRIATLWLMMAPLCALIFALALPLAPNDLWYHVRAGEFIARGAIPTQNAMSQGVPLTTPYFYQSWLAEWSLFQTLQWGGLSGLMLLRAASVGGAVACAVIAAARALARMTPAPPRLVAARWSALAGVLGFVLTSNNIDLRPQTFSMLFFGVWLVATGEFRAATEGRLFWGTFLVILTAIWANTHGAFAVGLLGWLALAVGDTLWHRQQARRSWLLLGFCAAAVALNPRGLKLYDYLAQLSRDEVSQRFVQEWRSPGFDDWHSLLFWLSAGGVCLWLCFGLARRKSLKTGDKSQNLALALFFVMAARDQRAILWFALALVPVVATLGVSRSGAPSVAAPVPRAAQALNAVLLGFLLACPLAFFPGVKAAWPWPAEFRRRFAPTPAALFPGEPPLLLESSTPTLAAEWLRLHPPRGLVFTDMVCGSYLAYATYPRIKPWCDPRIELFPVAFWEDYLRLSSGPPTAARELERQFSDALLDRHSQPALVQRLKNDAKWKIVAQNGSTVLFRCAASVAP